jgi:hypothetical protein
MPTSPAAKRAILPTKWVMAFFSTALLQHLMIMAAGSGIRE